MLLKARIDTMIQFNALNVNMASLTTPFVGFLLHGRLFSEDSMSMHYNLSVYDFQPRYSNYADP